MATTTATSKTIAQVTMLKQVMKQWKSMTLKRRLSASHSHVPSGFLAVYVGLNRIRFLIPVRFLHLPIFIGLLRKSEEEYGFKFSGGIVLPCEVEFFEHVLNLLYRDEKKYGRLEVHQFLKLISQVGFDSSSCKVQEGNYFSSVHDGLLPLMQKS